ncbi:MAG TPA: polysaccharide biosynthesis C-terminal domain-containing protein [Acidimicrobiales bacterium]|nr:polysaccharide biosynthesis C-terminal domain-containing protein [Acidimicrobiales bacterium]
MTRLSGVLRATRDSKIARNAGWVLSGELVTLASQLVMFIFITHTFESDVYGVFVGVVSLALFVSPFSSFGAGYLVVQRVVAKGEALVPAILRAWTTVIVGAVVFGATLISLRVFVIPQATPWLVVEIIFAELLFQQVVQVNRFVGQAIDKLWLAPAMSVSFGVSRVVFVIWYLGLRPNPTIVGWGFFYALSGMIGAVVGTVIIWSMVGDRVRVAFPNRRDLRDGLAFSLNVSSSNIKIDADKWLLVRMNEAAANGVYSAGYRILGLATVPNIALSDATYARFFSASGAKEAIALAKRLALVALVINGIGGAAMMLGATTIVRVMGDSYTEAADVLRWVAFVPLLSAWQVFAGNALSGIGHHRARLNQTISSAVLNIVLNLILIPSMSWRGAAIATIITELYLVVMHWRSLWRLASQDVTAAGASAAAGT